MLYALMILSTLYTKIAPSQTTNIGVILLIGMCDQTLQSDRKILQQPGFFCSLKIGMVDLCFFYFIRFILLLYVSHPLLNICEPLT
jgi:hypothetical protein